MSTENGQQDPLQRLVDDSVDPPARGALGAVKSALRRVTVRLGRPHALHQQEISRELLAAIRAVESGDAGVQPQLDELRVWLQAERNGIAEAKSQLTSLAGRIDQLAAQLQDHAQSIMALSEQVTAVGEQSARTEALTAVDVSLDRGSNLDLETFDAGPAGTVIGFRGQTPASDSGGPDGLYLGFEDYFRGSEDVIRERQRGYLKIVAEHAPVLDLGCGRGEFLELLAEAGIEARGVEIDPAMVARCRQKGLQNVEEADGLDYIAKLDRGAFGTIFASQVIEHLGFDQLQRLLALGLEKLPAGGLLVVETINPHNPQALKHFWIDPTHRNPLFPEVVIALCRLAGYTDAYIWHPGGSGDPDRDRRQAGDYSVVARTPA